MYRPSYTDYKVPNETIQSLIKGHAIKYPNSISLIDGDISLSYKELDELTDLIAKSLIEEYKINAESIVGVYINKSYQYIVACLSILKTGAIYLHLDEDYPTDILDYIISESTPELIVTCNSLITKIKNNNIPKLNLSLERDWQKDLNHELTINSNNEKTAIIGYTSGTTNTPKGVEVSHKACIYSYNKFWEETKNITNTNHFGYITYLAWDSFSPLVHGATGIMIPNEANFDMNILKNSISKYKINNAFFTPSLLDKLLNSFTKVELSQTLSTLNVIWVGGEIIKQSTIDKVYEVLPHTYLINNYGPTECFVVSQGTLTPTTIERDKTINAGYILQELEYKLFNDFNQDVTSSGQGYLYITGPALANKYFKNKKLTEEMFVGIAGKIFYNTGDFCHVDKNRKITLLGRSSFILNKNKSNAIAASEVENKILNIEGINQCVIINSVSETLVFLVQDSSANIACIEKELSKYCTSYRIIPIEEIPIKPASQKINYSELISLDTKKEK